MKNFDFLFANNAKQPILLSVKKIWDFAPHNSMTDLIRFQGRWFCTFRESTEHVYGENGIIRVLASEDGEDWQSVSIIVERGVDLRDPKFSVTPDGRLLLLVGGTVYGVQKNYVTRQPRVAFSIEGEHWSTLQPIITPHEWLWRLTWYEGKGYGASYRSSNSQGGPNDWTLTLFETSNGLDFQPLCQWDIPGYPNETTIRFRQNGEMVALVRRDQMEDPRAWIGTSAPPYIDWSWKISNHYLGGPNFIILSDGTQLAGGRFMYKTPYGLFEKTILAEMSDEDIHRILYLPSGGDCGYPGMVFEKGVLWMSYYSSHKKNTAIYLAKILFPS